VVHYWWGVKSGVKSPLGITVVLGVLLVARPVLQRIAVGGQRTQ
jgi:sulfoxide reductase heme-binding subunit YedZ